MESGNYSSPYYSGNLNVEIFIVSIERETSLSYSQSIDIQILPVATAPVLNVNTSREVVLQGTNATFVIDRVRLVDTDGSESLQLILQEAGGVLERIYSNDL